MWKSYEEGSESRDIKSKIDPVFYSPIKFTNSEVYYKVLCELDNFVFENLYTTTIKPFRYTIIEQMENIEF